MSDQSSQEPTMEEILASIRRIISEDEVPPEEGAAEPVAEGAPVLEEPVMQVEEPAPPAIESLLEPVVEAAPEPVLEIEDDVLELTEKVETLGDLELHAAPPVLEVVPPPPPPVYEAPPPVNLGSGLVSDPAATSAAAAFSHLSASVLMPREGRTLEDVVSEMLRPMLQQWLDQHLAGIVHQAVQAEVERISRSGRVG